jgi:hypothetical protein
MDVTDSVDCELQLAQAILNDALDHIEADGDLAFFDGLIALSIARRLASDAGVTLAHALDLAEARSQ